MQSNEKMKSEAGPRFHLNAMQTTDSQTDEAAPILDEQELIQELQDFMVNALRKRTNNSNRGNFRARGGRGGFKPSSNAIPRTCYYCKKPGHIQRYCYKKQADIKNGTYQSSSNVNAMQQHNEDPTTSQAPSTMHIPPPSPQQQQQQQLQLPTYQNSALSMNNLPPMTARPPFTHDFYSYLDAHTN